MLDIFKPTYMVDSIYNITPEQLKDKGKKVVFTDLDNTLIAWNHPHATDELRTWLKDLRDAAIDVIVLSNNNEERVDKAVEGLGITHIASAFKPRRKGFNKAFETIDHNKDEVIMVGDQVITDIIGANRFKVDSVLVKPILDSDAWNTKFNRFIEYKILKQIVKHNPNMEWRSSLDD